LPIQSCKKSAGILIICLEYEPPLRKWLDRGFVEPLGGCQFRLRTQPRNSESRIKEVFVSARAVVLTFKFHGGLNFRQVPICQIPLAIRTTKRRPAEFVTRNRATASVSTKAH